MRFCNIIGEAFSPVDDFALELQNASFIIYFNFVSLMFYWEETGKQIFEGQINLFRLS